MSDGPMADRRALLTRLLAEAGELAPGERIDYLTQLEGGWSRWSHIAVIGAPDGRERRYVIRVKAPFGLFDTSLSTEFAVFEALQQLDLPTPRAFGLHEDVDNPFGGEFFVMEHLPGSSANVWRMRDHASLRADWGGPCGIATDLVTYLARIHAIGADQAPAGLVTATFADIVARWRTTYEAAEFNRDPLLEEGFAWLDDNAPPPGPVRLVHGDYRIGNTLMQDARITAILDWELAYMGDPRFDLGYIATDYMAGKHLRPKTELLGAVADREWFFGEYERLTGAPLDRDAVRAFSVLGLVALIAMSYTGLRRYLDGRNTDFRRAWARYGLPGMRQDVAALLEW